MRRPESGPGSSIPEINKKIVIVENKDAIEAEARDAAEAKLTESGKELKGVGGFFKKVWKHNLFHEYYRQQEIAKARTKIEKNKNLYANASGDKTAHDKAMKSLVERFSQDYDEAVHTEAGESKTVMEKSAVSQQEIKNLIVDYATGKLDDASFREERVRILMGFGGLEDRKVVESEVHHTDNLLEVAKQVKAAVEHGRKLEELDLDFDVVIGRAKSGVRTEAQFNAVDKIVNKIQSSWAGKYIANETVLASAVAITYSVSAGLSQRVARSKALAWGTLGATAAIGAGVAGMRESKRIEEERRQHSREMAKNGKYDADNSPRRQEMERFRYETKASADLTRDITKYLEQSVLNPEEFKTLLDNLSSAEARIKMSDRNKIDLISYSDATAVEKERLDLDIARAKAKVHIKNMLDSGANKLEQSLEETLADLEKTWTERFTGGETGLEAKNSAFKKMKSKKVAIAALKGLATGLVVGTAFQEAASWIRSNEQGLAEGLLGREGHENLVSVTALEKFRMYISGDEYESVSGTVEDFNTPGGGIVKLPEGIDLVPNPANPGSFDMVKDGQVMVPGLNFEDGKFTPDSVNALAALGIESNVHVNSVTETIQSPQDLKQYVNEHPEQFERIRRTLWYDNDTPKPVFDKNELKLDWGGGGDGIDNNGNYVFNMARMAPDGSYHSNFSVDAQEAMKEGKLRMLLSLTRETQNMVVEVPVGPDGNVVMDPNDEKYKMFFKQENGKAVFIGKFAEIAERAGVDKDGVEKYKILATHVGEDRAAGDGGSIVKQTPITSLEYPPQDYFVTPPPVIPWFGRRPLEPLKRGIEAMPNYYHGPMTSEERERAKQNLSETIRNSPEASLDHFREAELYFSKQSAEYLSTLDRLSDEAGEMNKECRATVAIPVAGHQEGNSIYKTLENYLNQTANPESFELVLLVNRPDTDENGKPIEPDKTLAEINRFKEDHPELQVKVMDVVLPRAEAKIGNIRKTLNDVVLRRHHRRGNTAKDLIMISNDADNKGLAPEYIKNFVDKFDSNSSVDGLMGQLDWDPDSYVRNPLVHLGTRMFQFVDVQLRHQDKKFIASSGANFAFRSSIYSAINGYNTETTLAEDVELGRRIRLAREGSHKHYGIGFAGARVSRLYTSSRRAEKAVKEGLAPFEQWEKGFSAFDDEVRKVKWEDSSREIDYEDEEQVAKLVKEFEAVINRTYAKMSSYYGKNPKLYRRSLGWLGVKFKLDDRGRIKITDATKLIEGLKEYKTEGPRILERKITKKIKSQAAATPAATERAAAT